LLTFRPRFQVGLKDVVLIFLSRGLHLSAFASACEALFLLDGSDLSEMTRGAAMVLNFLGKPLNISARLHLSGKNLRDSI
jgi:hypothetical protein